jgi:hypothetical protein
MTLPPNWNEISRDGLWNSLNDRKRRPTPQTIIEAVMHSLREGGLKAFQEPEVIERMSQCDERARAEIKLRIKKLGIK